MANSTKIGAAHNRGQGAANRFSEPACEALTDYLFDTFED